MNNWMSCFLDFLYRALKWYFVALLHELENIFHAWMSWKMVFLLNISEKNKSGQTIISFSSSHIQLQKSLLLKRICITFNVCVQKIQVGLFQLLMQNDIMMAFYPSAQWSKGVIKPIWAF